MEQIVTLTLPKGASARFVRDMQDVLGALEGVADTGEIGTRGLEVLSIGVWVKLAAEPRQVHDVLMEVVRNLCEAVRLQGIAMRPDKLLERLLIHRRDEFHSRRR